jgi:hypothetical protein
VKNTIPGPSCPCGRADLQKKAAISARNGSTRGILPPLAHFAEKDLKSVGMTATLYRKALLGIPIGWLNTANQRAIAVTSVPVPCANSVLSDIQQVMPWLDSIATRGPAIYGLLSCAISLPAKTKWADIFRT